MTYTHHTYEYIYIPHTPTQDQDKTYGHTHTTHTVMQHIPTLTLLPTVHYGC